MNYILMSEYAKKLENCKNVCWDDGKILKTKNKTQLNNGRNK